MDNFKDGIKWVCHWCGVDDYCNEDDDCDDDDCDDDYDGNDDDCDDIGGRLISCSSVTLPPTPSLPRCSFLSLIMMMVIWSLCLSCHDDDYMVLTIITIIMIIIIIMIRLVMWMPTTGSGVVQRTWIWPGEFVQSSSPSCNNAIIIIIIVNLLVKITILTPNCDDQAGTVHRAGKPWFRSCKVFLYKSFMLDLIIWWSHWIFLMIFVLYFGYDMMM